MVATIEGGAGDVAASAYLFECKGIQRYIFGSSRLRQVIGASDLIAGIARSDKEDLLKAVFEAVDLEKPAMSRRAGGAFCVHADTQEVLPRFRRLWRLVTGVLYPGLEFSDVEPVSAETEPAAARCAYSSLTAVRENSAAFLPPAGHPFVRFNPRTGLPAVARSDQDTDELLDAVGLPQHRRSEELFKESADSVDRLALDFLPETGPCAESPFVFPRHFEPKEATAQNPAFPFLGRDRRIGVIHADLSGLGQVFQSVMENAQKSQNVLEVAQAIEKAVIAAARSACADTLLNEAVCPSKDPRLLDRDSENASECKMRIVPARPVLLGGDDITIIVRADLAIEFSERLLCAIERETAREFTNLKNASLPERLSACAGVAIVSAGHPFTAAARLAEGLCDAAKTTAKSTPEESYPSYLDFAVVTSTIDESLASWRDREHRIDTSTTYAGPRRVYAEDADRTADSLDSLLNLAAALKAAPGRGKLLEALGLRHDSKDAAKEAWERYWKVLDSDHPKPAKRLRKALKTYFPNLEEKAMPPLDGSMGLVSDALELIDIGAKLPQDNASGGTAP